MYQDENDILERLKHPEREAERPERDKLFLLRNVLNIIFILMALVAMIGIAFSWYSTADVTWCYILGLCAVFVKMVEAMFRMPHMLKKTSRRRR